MEKLRLGLLQLEQRRQQCGNYSRVLPVDEKCLKEKRCSVLRLRDALTMAGDCASVFVE